VWGECLYGIDEKARRKKPLGRPKCRKVSNIKMDLEKGVMDWTDLAQDKYL
jgi:hypothetical protein